MNSSSTSQDTIQTSNGVDWGNGVTYLGQTTLKEKTVNFGIKDADRLRDVSIIGKAGSGRGDLLINMALQDVARGIGTVVLDASGTVAPRLMERLDSKMLDQVVYLDPANAEYPYSWNILDDVRTLPEGEQKEKFLQILTSVYSVSVSPFLEYAAEVLIHEDESTLVTLHTLVTDEKARNEFFESRKADLKTFEEKLKEEPQITGALEEVGKYIAKDTLVRNVLGQQKSKFTLSTLSEGQVVIVDLSHIKMFPTRMTPIVRTFVEGTRIAGGRTPQPPALYLHDAIRYLGEDDVERTLQDPLVALTVSDTVIQEEDKSIRKTVLSRCNTVLSFVPHTLDSEVVEHVFSPYASAEDLFEMKEGDFIVALCIDGVRNKPFFAHTMLLSGTPNIGYQDAILASRTRFTTVRREVDASFKKGKDDKKRPKGKGPGGFQDAFRSIFEKSAQQMQEQQAGKKPQEKPVGSAKPTASPQPPPPAPSVIPPSASEKRSTEVPETVLKKMLYVNPVLS